MRLTAPDLERRLAIQRGLEVETEKETQSAAEKQGG
jgi:hypothetical protein